MCDTPLLDRLNMLKDRNTLRMHMPGHKGVAFEGPFSGVFPIDYTELKETGNLYRGLPPIVEAEEKAARYFGVNKAYFLTCGSTQGIFASIYLCCGQGSKIIADRCCHYSVHNAVSLFGLVPEYIIPNYIPDFEIMGGIDEEKLSLLIDKNPEASTVIVTSPNYHGIRLDIKKIAEIVHSRGKRLIVDQAHGAHFPAVGLQSAVSEGADLAVCSFHKTMPALTQSACLLSGGSFSDLSVRMAASVFGTSSPSYPIMASIDFARDHCENKGAEKYKSITKSTNALRKMINGKTKFTALTETVYPLLDPARLTVNTSGTGISGFKLSKLLKSRYNISCEMEEKHNCTFIITCSDDEAGLMRLINALSEISCGLQNSKEFKPCCPPFDLILPRVMSPSDAIFSEKDYLSIEKAAGRTAAQCVYSCPPGISVICPGEVITQVSIEYLLLQGYNKDTAVACVK